VPSDPVKAGSSPADVESSEESPVLNSPAEDPAASEVPSRYRVHLLPGAKPTERGVLYRRGSKRFLMAWGRVAYAFAAEVGEPEGVRTIAFDLAVEVTGPVCVVCRMEAEPGENAMRVARAIQLGVGPEICNSCIKSLAADGVPSLSFPDTETFGEAVLESVRFVGAARQA
jgi:hypothetical protein